MVTPQQKKELKRVLFNIATPEERRELNALETSELNDRLDAIMKRLEKTENLDVLLSALSGSVEMMRRSSSKIPDRVSERMDSTMERLSKSLVDKLEELKQVHGRTETISVPLYKGMIEAISGVNETIKNRPTPSWRWPQYASVSIRDKNFANVNPASSDNQVFNSIVSGTATNSSAGTAKRLISVSTPCKKVTICVPVTNTGVTVSVGDATASAASGLEVGHLIIKGGSQDFWVEDASLIYFDVDTNNDRVVYNIYNYV